MEIEKKESKIEKERIEFKNLLSNNPNYFGNLEDSSFEPVKKIIGNTTYEELTCIGFNPALNLLEATVHIKLPGGYNGMLCTPGSTEYVRFYIDYGAGWIDLGTASFNVHDIPNMQDCAKKKNKPLTYVVTMSLDPHKENCHHPILPKVRVILSWQTIPFAGQPNWTPVWGNVFPDQHIQIKPRDPIFGDVFELVPKDMLKKLPPLLAEVKKFPIPLPDPPLLNIPKLAELYTNKNKGRDFMVEPHRFGHSYIKNVMKFGNQETIMGAITEWQVANINWGEAVAALEKTKADTSYEELECLGLEYNLERLIATFLIKKPVGYSGNLCAKGSIEYVAFWADWNNTCEWTYLNTVAVNVHDIAEIPPGGLAYSAILPVDLNAIRTNCEDTRISRIRAVLSWNSPPSTTDPEALDHWGNRLDTHVQIRPGTPVTGDKPIISIIGGIGIADIDIYGNGMTKHAATFAFGGSPADPWLSGRACPFGGLVIIQGPPLSGFKYRLRARKFGDSLTEKIVKDSFNIVNWLGIGSNITPDPVTGFANYIDTLSNMNQVLAHWNPTGDELNEIRLEKATLADVIVGTTPWYSVRIDNTSPWRKPPVAPYEPPTVTCEIHIDSGGDCKDFVKGVKIKGSFVARDENFGAFSLMTLPSSKSPPNPTTSTPSTSETASFVSGGDKWELETGDMDPCGYVVLLQIWDRTIVNSVPGQHNYNYYDVGFCLRKG